MDGEVCLPGENLAWSIEPTSNCVGKDREHLI
jgi:hypothetical protein